MSKILGWLIGGLACWLVGCQSHTLLLAHALVPSQRYAHDLWCSCLFVVGVVAVVAAAVAVVAVAVFGVVVVAVAVVVFAVFKPMSTVLDSTLIEISIPIRKSNKHLKSAPGHVGFLFLIFAPF